MKNSVKSQSLSLWNLATSIWVLGVCVWGGGGVAEVGHAFNLHREFI